MGLLCSDFSLCLYESRSVNIWIFEYLRISEYLKLWIFEYLWISEDCSWRKSRDRVSQSEIQDLIQSVMASLMMSKGHKRWKIERRRWQMKKKNMRFKVWVLDENQVRVSVVLCLLWGRRWCKSTRESMSVQWRYQVYSSRMSQTLEYRRLGEKWNSCRLRWE